MNLLLISRRIWRHRIATLPVIALTLLGACFVVMVKDPEYEAYSSYVLINPPAPPTAEEVAANPTLGRVDPNNPFTRFTDQSVVVDLLASSLSNETARRALSEEGADRYTVAPSSDFGYSGLLVEIRGVGSTPRQAMQTAELVGTALTSELDRLQASRGVAARYRIQTQRVVAPDHAEQRVSGKLRTLVGVFALGAILLFVVISAAEGLSALRAERNKQDLPKDKGSIEGAGTKNSRALAWLRGPRRAGSKEAVPMQMDEGESIEEIDTQESIEDAGTNGETATEGEMLDAVAKIDGAAAHERIRAPRGAGSKA